MSEPEDTSGGSPSVGSAEIDSGVAAKNRFKAAATAAGSDATKMRLIAQLAMAKRRTAEQLRPDNNSNNLNDLTASDKFRAATQTVIATQALADSLKDSTTTTTTEQEEDAQASARAAVFALTGFTLAEEQPVPSFLHATLKTLVRHKAVFDAQIDGVKASLDGIIHWEAIMNTLYITVAIFFAWFVGYWQLGIGWVFVAMFFVNGAYRRNMQRIKGKVEVEASRILGLKKLETDVETVEWFNQFLRNFWLQYEPGLSASLKSSIDQTLYSSKPSFLDDLSLTIFTLGSEAPRIDQIKTMVQRSDDTLIMEWGLLFVPVDEDGVSKRDRERGNVRHSKIEIKAKFGMGVLGPLAIPIPVVVEHLEFRGNLRLELKFVSKYPHVSKIEYCFTETPIVDFSLRPLKAIDMMDMPGLKNSLNQIVASALSSYVTPRKNTIDLDAIMNGTGAEVPVGLLKITLHEAKHLKNFELAGISDPYVLVRLGGKEVARTKTIANSLNPYWGQTLYVPVLNTHIQWIQEDVSVDSLELEVFDDNEASSDKSMGCVAPLRISRWVKLLDDSKLGPNANEETPVRGPRPDSAGSMTTIDEPSAPKKKETAPTPEPEVQPPEPPKSLSSGPDLSPEERETFVTEWGTPYDESGSDVWHPLVTKDSIVNPNKEKKKTPALGEVRLEMAYLPLMTLEAVTAAKTTKPENSEISTRGSTETLKAPATPATASGVLTVTVHSGKEFPGQRVSTLRGEVTALDGGQEWAVCGSTPAVKRSNNPTWDCPIRFFVSDTESASVKVTIKDGHKTVGDVILEVKTILKSLQSKDPIIDWFKLSNAESSKLRLTFQFHPLNPLFKTNKPSSSRMPKGVLKFKLVKAKSLVNVEIMGRKSDPYAKISIGRVLMGASLVKDNTLDPVWNETFYGVMYSRMQTITIELWDYNNVKKDKTLGTVEIKVDDLLKANELPWAEQSQLMQKYLNDGLKVEISGSIMRVLAPIYLQKGDLENEAVQASKNTYQKVKEFEQDKIAPMLSKVGLDAEKMEHRMETVMQKMGIQEKADDKLAVGDSTSSLSQQTTASLADAKAALLQRGFLYFELEYYDVMPPENQITALDQEQYEFIERTKNDVTKEVSRLNMLTQVKVLTPEESFDRIQEVIKRGYVGSLDPDRAALLTLPKPIDIIQAHDSGILRFHIYGAQGITKPIDAYIDIRLDDESVYSTRIQKKSQTPSWNATTDICIRSVQGQRLSIILFDARDTEKRNAKEDHMVGIWNAFLTDILGHRKKWITLSGAGGSDEIKLCLSTGYMPINKSLSDTIHNSGMLYIDFHSATNLEAVDNGGTSDPYCLIQLNDDLIHKTQVHKKNLNPVFNESINIAITSRLKSTINFILKDYNAIGRHTTLGTAELDLMDIKTGELLKVSIPLAGARCGELNMSIFFDYNAGGITSAVRKNTTTIDAAAARGENGEENAALKMTKGTMIGTIDAIKEIGKQFKGSPKQSQENVLSAIQVASNLGAEVKDLTHASEEEKQQYGLTHMGSASNVFVSSISGNVILAIESARELKAVDENGEADPYVKVTQLLHGKVKTLHKTRVVKKNRNPTWNETCQFAVPPARITLVIKDYNLFGSSKPLGEVELDLDIMFGKDNEFDTWIPVGLGGMGEIHVSGVLQRAVEPARSITNISIRSEDNSSVHGGGPSHPVGSVSPNVSLGRKAKVLSAWKRSPAPSS
ncbi:hypothetical protein BCR33DRAFT_710938 [Rhizoclosmatium globosum]|uniref:Tricalbin n=1 Tax=Rhizoclosmatium globosum TaxID=329046 RepID=A0A1Y2D2K6_9FUNG|nr:hypothetical protein BCR33DRAFT_710938 [Rhizoclosmatium globosum]|eukprot:ORY53531.1 hypothetical protein BCR33DRAFT_710938 [Rhizoclosmatium globosum]